MNDTETAIQNENHPDAPKSAEWQSSRKVEPVGYDQATVDFSLRGFRSKAEVHAISSALERTHWNRKLAAKLLRISYRGLLYKIRRHNIVPPVERS